MSLSFSLQGCVFMLFYGPLLNTRSQALSLRLPATAHRVIAVTMDYRSDSAGLPLSLTAPSPMEDSLRAVLPVVRRRQCLLQL